MANLNLAVANVALPDIGKSLGASQTALNLVAVGFTLGLAASVLYLGALSDHHGRRLMLIAGLTLTIPTAALVAWAPSVEVLILARLLGGFAAGMAFPTTLSLITALFKGVRQTKAIALWSGIGGGASALGPLAVGALLTRFWWGSAFVLTIPVGGVRLAGTAGGKPACRRGCWSGVDPRLLPSQGEGAGVGGSICPGRRGGRARGLTLVAMAHPRVIRQE